MNLCSIGQRFKKVLLVIDMVIKCQLLHLMNTLKINEALNLRIKEFSDTNLPLYICVFITPPHSFHQVAYEQHLFEHTESYKTKVNDKYS